MCIQTRDHKYALSTWRASMFSRYCRVLTLQGPDKVTMCGCREKYSSNVYFMPKSPSLLNTLSKGTPWIGTRSFIDTISMGLTIGELILVHQWNRFQIIKSLYTVTRGIEVNNQGHFEHTSHHVYHKTRQWIQHMITNTWDESLHAGFLTSVLVVLANNNRKCDQ